jgi:hypothetical protein
VTIRTTTVFETDDGKLHTTEKDAVMHALDVIGKDIIKNHSNGSIRSGLLHHAAELIPLLQFVSAEPEDEEDEPDDGTKGALGEYKPSSGHMSPFLEGQEAQRAGADYESNNPYYSVGDYDKYAAWRRGWRHAIDQRKDCEGGPC